MESSKNTRKSLADLCKSSSRRRDKIIKYDKAKEEVKKFPSIIVVKRKM